MSRLLIVGFCLVLFVAFQACEEQVLTVEEVEETTTDGSDFNFTTNSKDTTAANAVKIVYSGTTVTITNPFEVTGVTVNATNGSVVVTSTLTDTEVSYILSGITTDGSIKINSEYKYNLILDGVGILNPDGPAINIQSGKKATVTTVSGTINKLVDGSSYAATETDSKGTFFSEGQLIFKGSGTLYVTGNYKHALCSDDYISIESGDLIAVSNASDAIHANDYFKQSGGNVKITSTGDGIEAEEGYIEITGGSLDITTVDEAITTSYDGTDTSITPYLTVAGGTLTLTTTGETGHALESAGQLTIQEDAAIVIKVSGRGSKGIKAVDATLTGGNIVMEVSGSAFYDSEDAEVTSPAGINCSGALLVDGGILNITGTGTGGKGIKTDGGLTINKGTVTISVAGSAFTYNRDSYEAKAISSDGAVVINEGTVTVSATDDGIKSEVSVSINGGIVNVSRSTEGIEAPLITINNGNVSVVSTDDCLNATKGTGGESNDGSLLTLAGGTVSLNSSGGDPVDSNGNIIMTGGTVVVQGPPSQPEVALDYNGTFKISGGLLIASGPNAGNMIEATSNTSTQYGVLVKMNVSANTLFSIQDASGNSLVTYAPVRNAYYFVFSSPELKSGTAYKVFTGGSVSGGTNVNGLTINGTYTGGTQRGNFTANSMVTSITL